MNETMGIIGQLGLWTLGRPYNLEGLECLKRRCRSVYCTKCVEKVAVTEILIMFCTDIEI